MEMDPVVAELVAKMEALVARVEALEAAAAVEEPAEEVEAEAVEEEEDEKVELSARVEVLRDLHSVELGAWTEDELVEVKMRAPKAYAKVVTSLKAARKPVQTSGAPRSKALGSTGSTVTLSQEEAFVKAKEEFERGGSFADAYRRLSGVTA
jgi:hypothetical protein